MVDFAWAMYEFLEKKKFTISFKQGLLNVVNNFSIMDAKTITSLEVKTNHDLKAIEQFFILQLQKHSLENMVPYVNLGIGSEDINSIALGRLAGDSRASVFMPQMRLVVKSLLALTIKEKDTIMVARTHATAANLTTFGKEIANTLFRLCDEIEIFSSLEFTAKCTGEVGSLQGLAVIDGRKDWLAFTDTFIRGYGLVPSHAATQIAPYDSLIRFLQSLERINSILIDFVKNMWLYVLLGYVKVMKVDTEVGSAGMPHKVNPIYFEGAEGGLEMANGIFETLCRALPINRLQRDFSDSTTRRNLSIPLGLSVLSYLSIVEGLQRITVDTDAIAENLARHQEVWVETVKTFAILHGVPNAYDLLKSKTRGKTLTYDELMNVIDLLPLSKEDSRVLFEIIKKGKNPYPARIVDEAVKKANKVFKLTKSGIN